MIRDRSILALLTGEMISRLGSQFTMLALPWFVLVTTGSTSKMGLVFAAELAPMVVFGIPFSTLVYRFGPRRWMVAMDTIRAPLAAIIPLLHEVGGLSFPVVLLVAALLGTFTCGYMPAQRTILPAVVGEDEQRLAQANGLVEGTTNLTSLLGPALGGVLIVWMGAANVMWLDAGSFALSALIIGSLRIAHEPQSQTERQGMLAGLRYLRTDLFLTRVSLSSLLFGFAFPMLAASFPVLAYEQYDRNARVAGLLFAVIGAGQVVGSLLTYRLVTRVRPMLLASGAALFTGPPLWLLVPHVPMWVVGVTVAVIGASVPLINAPYIGMLTMRVPKELRGHVLQSLITINQLLGPLGYVLAGVLFASVGLHTTYALIAALGSLATVNFVVAATPYRGAPVAEAPA
jgi:MFS family permease